MMPILFIMLLPLLGIAFTFGIPAYRLRRAIQRPFPAHFAAILRRNIPTYSGMPVELQDQLQRLVKQFLHQKKFVGCDDLNITDEMRVTIAGKACMLLLNRAPRVYPNLDVILVYPSAFIVPRNEIGIGGIVTHAHQHLSGESWSDGRVILAWDHVQQADGYDFRHDVVLHEFAHQLDSESGSTNGAPYLPTTSRYRRWAATLSQAYFNLQMAASNQTESVFDYYGATNPAEFFAVVTETFFTDPMMMAAWEPALFEEFRNYYRVDPREWVGADGLPASRRFDAPRESLF
jgi:Mlc titration factor MtfA (ptsG expression regulator)